MITNKKTITIIIITLLLVSSIITIMPVSAKSSTIHVYPGKSIQAAIDVAKAGDTVLVHAGTYNEKVIVSKQLILKGDKAVLDLATVGFPTWDTNSPPAHRGNAGIFVEASGVTVSGFTIKNVPVYTNPNPPNPLIPPLPFAFGIRFYGSFSGGKIENNIVCSDYYGIGISGAVGTSGISNVAVQNNKVTATIGIMASNTPNMAIKSNVVSAANITGLGAVPTGITVSQSGFNNFTATPPIELPPPAMSNVEICYNTVNSERNGINISGNVTMGISNVKVQLNRVTALAAISITNCRNLAVKGNFISAMANPATANVSPIGITITQTAINNPFTPTPMSDVSVQSNVVNSEGQGISLNGVLNAGILNAVIQYNIVTAKPSEVITTLNPNSILYAIQATVTPDVIIRANVLSIKTTLNATSQQPMGQPVGIRLNQAFLGGLVEFNAINSELRGVQVNIPSNITIQYNWVYSSIVGIDLPNAPNVVIKGNIISAKNNSVLYWAPYGIYAQPGGNIANALIESNRINSEHFGIWFNGPTSGISSGVQVLNNVVCNAIDAIDVGNTPKVVIRGNTIEARNKTIDYPGIKPFGINLLSGSTNATIEKNRITSDLYGICLSSPNVTVRGNTVYTAVYAIQANSAPNVTISSNVVSAKNSTYYPREQPNGIQLQGSFSGGLIEDNEISSEFNGISLGGGAKSGMQILNNTVYTAIYAINVGNAPNVVIRENILTAKRNVSLPTNNPNGILLSGSSGALIENNRITSDYFGIWLTGSSNVEVCSNTVYTAVFAIQTQANTPGVVISDNVVSAKANADYPGKNPNGIYLSGSFSNGVIENNKINSECFGIFLENHANIKVLNNKIFSSVTAIWANAPNVLISGNTLTATDSPTYGTANGIQLNGAWSGGTIEKNIINSDNNGISLNGQSNILMNENNIVANYTIYAQSGNTFTVTGNTLQAATLGIGLDQMGNSAVVISGNTVVAGLIEIYAGQVVNSRIENNIVQAMGTINNLGIILQGTTSTVRWNTVTGNFSQGIVIGGPLPGQSPIDSHNNIIIGNTIVGGAITPDCAFWFLPSAHHNTATGNTISGVDLEFQDDSTTVPSNNLVYGNTILP